MSQSFTAKTAVAAIALVAVSSLAASARTYPMPQRIVSRGALTHATAGAPRTTHDVWGAIATMRGSALTVRLRGGRIQVVDATDALASGRVSAPLFVGKLVEVAGAYDARHVMRAESVTRVPRVDATTPLDR